MNEHAFEVPQLGLFIAAAVAAIAGTVLGGGSLLLPLAFAGVAVAIWHGAFDNVLAQEALAPILGRRWRLVFYPGYLALAAGCLGLWFFRPAWALGLFLLYSALHFGTEREPTLRPAVLLTGFATGLLPIVASCHWWPGQVAGIFGEMLRGQSALASSFATTCGAALWPTAMLAATGTLLLRRKGAVVPVLLLLTQLCLFRWCPPLPAFAVYFCLWHTPEHLLSTSEDAGGRFSPSVMLQHLGAGTVPWLLTLLAVAVASWFGRHTAEAYAGTLFVALSALTVPHMVLGEVCRRAGRNSLPSMAGVGTLQAEGMASR